MEIKILGTGCSKCIQLTQATEKAAKELGVQFNLEKVTDLEKILSYAVMSTPALVIDGVVKSAGRIPDNDDLKKILTSP